MSLLRYRGALYRRAQPIEKTKLFRLGNFTVYRVDGAEIRENWEPDFTNWAQPLRFPDLIPPNELWLDAESAGSEIGFFLGRALLEHKLMSNGSSYEAAVDVGAEYEQNERKKVAARHGMTRPSVPDEVKKQLLTTLEDGIEVWLVDGGMVRTYFFVDFTQGGHDLVFDFIPDRQIWLDDDLVPEERSPVLHHEHVERTIMEQEGLDYPAAHLIALRAEQDFRRSTSEPHEASMLRYHDALYVEVT